jgi:hypothetical protein
MQRTYAVVWQVDGGPAQVGKLALGPGLVLEGVGSELRVPPEELVGVDRATAERRLGGRPTIRIRRSSGQPVSIAPLDGPGRAQELREAVFLLSPVSHPPPT